MAEFSDIFLGETYLEPYCKFTRRLGLVFVEGLRDIPFWDGILNQEIADEEAKYDINHASYEGTRGKTVLYKYLHHSNKYAVFAIDSDFDFICPNHSENAIKLSECQFVLQTYAYSKESVVLHHTVIEDCLSKIKITSPIKFSVENYVLRYSEAIYEALTRFLFQKNNGVAVNDDIFHQEIKPELPVIGENYTLQNDPIKPASDKARLISQALDLEIQKQDEFLAFKQEMESKGLNKENAASFVNGHHFEEAVISPLVNELIKKFKFDEFEKIKIECSEKPQLLNDRKNELFNFIKKELSFDAILHLCTKKYETPFANLIKAKHLSL